MSAERISGVLLHVTSLPSFGGVGDFGPAAYGFVDFLAAAKQRLWQVLPLSPTGYGSSPYSALSAFAGNPLLISSRVPGARWMARPTACELCRRPARARGPMRLRSRLRKENSAGRRSRGQLPRHTPAGSRPALPELLPGQHRLAHRLRHLQRAAPPIQLRSAGTTGRRNTRGANPSALTSLHERQCERSLPSSRSSSSPSTSNGRPCAPTAPNATSASSATSPSSSTTTAPTSGPIPSSSSSTTDLRPIRVSGVPPDYFSATGQRWGNPLYKWDAAAGARLRLVGRPHPPRAHALRHHSPRPLPRLRSLLGHSRRRTTPPSTASGSRRPATRSSNRFKEIFGDLPFIAEDLGLITKEVDELREHFGMPGMRILQFGFADRGAHLYLPHRYVDQHRRLYRHPRQQHHPRLVARRRHRSRARQRSDLPRHPHRSRRRDRLGDDHAPPQAPSPTTCIFPLQDILAPRQRSPHEYAPPPQPATGPGAFISTHFTLTSRRNSPPSWR